MVVLKGEKQSIDDISLSPLARTGVSCIANLIGRDKPTLTSPYYTIISWGAGDSILRCSHLV